MCRTRLRQRGLTMIELILFIVIVGIAVIGVLQVISLNTSRSADPLLRKQALAIAEGLLEEVRGARFTYCDASDVNVEQATSAADCTKPEQVGAEQGNARPFDNVNDYVAAWNTPQQYTTDLAGNALPAGYRATVAVSQQAFGAAAALIPAAAALRITVTVTYGANNADSVVLDTYRTRYAPQSP